MVELSKQNAEKAGVSDKATFMRRPLRNGPEPGDGHHDVPAAQINMKLRPKILDLKPGTRIVSNSFTMEDWTADETATVTEGCQTWCTALLWIVPAKVEGRWQTADGELTFAQTFQQVSGTLQKHGTSAAITDGRLRGAELSMTSTALSTWAVSRGTRSWGRSPPRADRPLAGHARGSLINEPRV